MSNPLAFLSRSLVRGYRSSLAFWLGGNCRFYPSCSCYAEEALQHFPWGRAIILILRRLIKCHPFSVGGYDPVPIKQEVEVEV